MPPHDIAAIERHARRLRAAEMRRLHGIASTRLRLYGQLLAASASSLVHTVSRSLRPLFSWNPQARHPF